MRDYALFSFLIAQIEAGFTHFQETVKVKQGWQPTSQGALTGQVVYIAKVMSGQYGFSGESYAFNTPNDNFDISGETMLAGTFQVSSLIGQDQALTADALTADDLLIMAMQWLQADITVQAFQDVGLGIERIINIRQSFFTNDKDNYENAPSFDFNITYTQSLAFTVAKINEQSISINRV